MQQHIIERTVEHVRHKLSGECSGHDWWHVYRVWQVAVKLAKTENADLFVVQLAALLHDIADWKFNNGDHSAGPRAAGEWLAGLGTEAAVIRHVQEIIGDMSFRGANVVHLMSTIEGKVVQDADRLDAIGAIGIARTFAYGGFKGRPIHAPEAVPRLHNSFEEYMSNSGPTISHFYEKLLLVRDRLNTQAAREVADERHEFMEQFLERFYEEWEGRK